MITLLDLTQTGPDRFLARFDNGESIRLSAGTISDLSLSGQMTLSEEEYETICSAASLSLCKQRALRIIGARAMSVKELKDRLIEKGETVENAETTVQWLLDINLLDDQQYAEMCVRHYASKGYGIGRIRNELYRRGISRDLWEEALDQIPDQDDKIDHLLRKKIRSNSPSRDDIRKAADYLYRRGFRRDEITSAIERFKQEMEFMDDGL